MNRKSEPFAYAVRIPAALAVFAATALFAFLPSAQVFAQTDEDVPSVSTFTFNGSSSTDTMVAGDYIDVEVVFTKDVEIPYKDQGGNPVLALNVGGVLRYAQLQEHFEATAERVGFRYVVVEGDEDLDGISIPPNALSRGESPIQDDVGRDADLTHDGMAPNPRFKVDAVAPVVSSIAITSDPGEDATYRFGDRIEVTVTFSEEVTVTYEPVSAGKALVELNIGGAGENAWFESAEGAAAIFAYTVGIDDEDTDGISIDANKLTTYSDYFVDGAGNGAYVHHAAVAPDAGHKVAPTGGL